MQAHYYFLQTHKTVENIQKIILKDCEQKYKKAEIVVSKNLTVDALGQTKSTNTTGVDDLENMKL
jgi:hypothetical protein